MATQVLIRPVITEKSQQIGRDGTRFTFVVAKDSTKPQIKVAVQEMFDVKVKSINTLRMPAKLKTRFTKRGLQKGRRNAYKKAIVTLRDGETIDFFGEG